MNPPPLLDPRYLNQDKKLRAPRATAVPKEQLLSSLQLSPKWIAGKKMFTETKYGQSGEILSS